MSGVMLAQRDLSMPKLVGGTRPGFVSGQDCGHLCDRATVLCDRLIV